MTQSERAVGLSTDHVHEARSALMPSVARGSAVAAERLFPRLCAVPHCWPCGLVRRPRRAEAGPQQRRVSPHAPACSSGLRGGLRPAAALRRLAPPPTLDAAACAGADGGRTGVLCQASVVFV